MKLVARVMTKRTLNSRQEIFVNHLLEGRSQKDAYIQAGYRSTGNAAEVAAARLIRNVKVASCIAERKNDAARRAETTVDSLVAELDEMLQLAIECENPSAGVSAVMGKAKLLGLVVDRAEVAGTMRKPARESTEKQTMSLEEWQAKFAPKSRAN